MHVDQEAYRSLRTRLGSDSAAEKFLAAQLRRLADHLESGDDPVVFSCSPALAAGIGERVNGEETIEDYNLCLSWPWGG